VKVTTPPFVWASAAVDVYVATGSGEPFVGPLSVPSGFAVPWPLLVKVHPVAPAGGVQVICVDWPAVTLVGFAVTTIAFHTAKFVETDMVEGLTVILAVGVPLMWGFGQDNVALPLVNVHPLST